MHAFLMREQYSPENYSLGVFETEKCEFIVIFKTNSMSNTSMFFLYSKIYMI